MYTHMYVCTVCITYTVYVLYTQAILDIRTVQYIHAVLYVHTYICTYLHAFYTCAYYSMYNTFLNEDVCIQFAPLLLFVDFSMSVRLV